MGCPLEHSEQYLVDIGYYETIEEARAALIEACAAESSTEKMERYTVTLPKAVADYCRTRGGGNLSAGIREVVQEANVY